MNFYRKNLLALLFFFFFLELSLFSCLHRILQNYRAMLKNVHHRRIERGEGGGRNGDIVVLIKLKANMYLSK